MFRRIRFRLLPAILLATACAAGASFEEYEPDNTWAGGGKSDAVTGPILVSEVATDPASSQWGAFVELRNVGVESIDLTGWFLSFDNRRGKVEAVAGHPSTVAPGGLAVVIDDDLDLATARLPRGVPIVTTSFDLGEALVTSSRDSRKITVRAPDEAITDLADASAPRPDRGVALERLPDGTFAPSALGQTPGERNVVRNEEAIQVFFTNPPIEVEDDVAPVLEGVIAGATRNLWGAFYQVNNLTLVDALVDARVGRGVDVRLVTDNDWYFKENGDAAVYREAYGRLERSGSTVVYDTTKTGGPRGSALMHDKFLVIDDAAVWTGSYNLLADNHTFNHADNALLFQSPELAEIHKREFLEMWQLKRFGTQKRYEWMTDTSLLEHGHQVHIDGTQVETFFAPKYRPLEAMKEAVLGAKDSVYFASFSFYQPELGAAMVERFGQGVDVRGVVYNASTAGASSQYLTLTAAGADVRWSDVEYDDADGKFNIFLHHKFIIVDYGTEDAKVLTGSFNFSDSATEKNDEAMYVIHDRRIVDEYYRIFRSIYDTALGTNRDKNDLVTIRITEVMSTTSAAATGAPDAFIELQNVGEADVDLRTLTVSHRHGVRYKASDLAGKTKVAAGRRVALSARSFELAPSDAIVVYDAKGRIVASFDAPIYSGAGRSLSRDDVAAPDLAATWTVGAPTPGE